METYWILCRLDLYFLLRYVLSLGSKTDRETGRNLIATQFILERCREVQGWNHDILDVWSRYHLKSTVKSYGLVIQDLLLDPEATIGTFSHTRGLAKSHGRPVRNELQDNRLLIEMSWDHERGAYTFWKKRPKDVLWSMDDGLVLNRRFENHTASLEFWGVVDSHPTGKHFSIMNYDDLVTKESVGTPEQIQKTTDSWEESLNLGVPESGTFRYTGTFWAYGDTYHTLLERGIDLRLHPCYELRDVTYAGTTKKPLEVKVDEEKPVLYSGEWLEKERAKTGERVFAAQMLCNPTASIVTNLRKDWLRHYSDTPGNEAKGKNLYVLMDQGGKKPKAGGYRSDWTVIWVVAVGSDQTAVIVDGLRDKLGLKERAEELFRLHRTWNKPAHRIVDTRIEQYGVMADSEHVRFVQEVEKYRFHITEVGGFVDKDTRIGRVQPWFSDGRILLPERMPRVRRNGETYDLIEEFVDIEYTKWPHSTYKDMLDCLSRIAEPELPILWPSGDLVDEDTPETREQWQERIRGIEPDTSWMGW